jgi:preprotein translocase subunit SecD
LKRATARWRLGDRIAIVLDGRVVSAPAVSGPIGAQAEISGRFTPGEAEELAKVLRSGALPASVRFLSETLPPATGTVRWDFGRLTTGSPLDVV